MRLPPPPADINLAFLGFGEAAQAFVEDMDSGARPALRGFDIKALAEEPSVRSDKQADFARFNVVSSLSASEAFEAAQAILSLVTPDQSLSAALSAADAIPRGTFYFDGNSVSPKTKRMSAEAIEAAGGLYVDVAIMAPVRPKLLGTPLLVSGPHAASAAAWLQALGFRSVSIQAGPVGAASAVKMIRSVMVKGIEALTGECVAAAIAAGVDAEVLGSLDASETNRGWADRADYNLDRMMVHGSRRAAELAEVVATLEELGVTPAMTRAAASWQAAVGSAGLAPPPEGYRAKIQLISKTKALP